MIYKHHLPDFLMQGLFPLHVTILGAGGTGSQVVNNLARINYALLKLGHAGLNVTLYDDDLITEANLGRQLFSESELGMHKSVALITRINRFYGFNWTAIPEKFTTFDDDEEVNLIITCVDTIKVRKNIYEDIQLYAKAQKPESFSFSENTLFYWLDFGNSKSSGQVILGTAFPNIKQLASKDKDIQYIGFLKLLYDLYPSQLNEPEDMSTPSCSLAEALSKQDLFINSALAQFGCQLLWKLLKEQVIEHQGAFLNLESYSLKPIKIKPHA